MMFETLKEISDKISKVTQSHIGGLGVSTRLQPATDNSREVCKTRKTGKTRQTCEKKGRARDNVKIDYTCFAIRSYSCTI